MTAGIVRFAAFWLLLAALYALFAGDVSVTEAIAGLIATGLGALYGLLLHKCRSVAVALRAPWPRMVLRPVAALAPDASRVGRVLLKTLWGRPEGSAGMVSRQRFRSGQPNPADAGRRGIVTLALSLAPNGYVLAIEESNIVLHSLAPAAPSTNVTWPA